MTMNGSPPGRAPKSKTCGTYGLDSRAIVRASRESVNAAGFPANGPERNLTATSRRREAS